MAAPRFGRLGTRLLAAGAVALGVTFFFMVFGEAPVEVSSAAGDSFSRSAIGYRALVEFLEAAGERPLVSRFDTGGRLGPHAGLLVLEPPPEREIGAATAELVATARGREAPVVVVLPKWRGREDARRPGWLERAEPLPAAEVRRRLRTSLGVAEAPELRRPEALGREGWEGPLAVAGSPPAIDRPQLLAPAPGFVPLLAAPEGVLVAYAEELGVHVVADPDLVNTHGLVRGGNAVVAYRLLAEEIAVESWVIDEVLHGFEHRPSLWRELLRLPLVFFTLQLGVAALLALWAAVGRFGRPEPVPPRLPPGALTLIDNTARLFARGGHTGHTLERYLDLVVRQAAAAFGLPAGLDREEAVARLAALGRRRQGAAGEDLERLGRRAVQTASRAPDRRRALATARRLWTWRQEVLDGGHRRRADG